MIHHIPKLNPTKLQYKPEKRLQWASDVYCVQFHALYPKHKHYRVKSGQKLSVCPCGHTVEWVVKNGK